MSGHHKKWQRCSPEFEGVARWLLLFRHPATFSLPSILKASHPLLRGLHGWCSCSSHSWVQAATVVHAVPASVVCVPVEQPCAGLPAPDPTDICRLLLHNIWWTKQEGAGRVGDAEDVRCREGGDVTDLCPHTRVEDVDQGCCMALQLHGCSGGYADAATLVVAHMN